jgi:hypothetical protein
MTISAGPRAARNSPAVLRPAVDVLPRASAASPVARQNDSASDYGSRWR